MAVITPTLDNANCSCGSIVTVQCDGSLVCQDFCDLVRQCPAFVTCKNFFGDLCDTPTTCQPNKILGTDSSCGGVVLLDPCTVLQNCGIADIKVKASSSDNIAGYLIDKLGICPASSGSLTLTSDGNFGNEKLLLCLTNPPTTLIATTDGPGTWPNCSLGRPVLQGNAASPTGWVATCPVQRAIGKITLATSYQQNIPNNDTDFFIPNGTWNFSGVGVNTTTVSFTGCAGLCSNTGTNAAMIVPRTGWYMVGMKGCSNVGQGVHTVRYQVQKVIGTTRIDPPILDDRFEGPIYQDAALENSYADNSFDGTLSAPLYQANMVRGLFGYGFGQSAPVFLNAGDILIFICKYNTVVTPGGEVNTAGASISIHGLNDNSMTNGTGPGTEIWMVELDQTFYPV